MYTADQLLLNIPCSKVVLNLLIIMNGVFLSRKSVTLAWRRSSKLWMRSTTPCAVLPTTLHRKHITDSGTGIWVVIIAGNPFHYHPLCLLFSLQGLTTVMSLHTGKLPAGDLMA